MSYVGRLVLATLPSRTHEVTIPSLYRSSLSYYTTLHYTTLHYTSLHYTTLHYTSLHYTTLHYTILHYTGLHFNKPGHNLSNLKIIVIEKQKTEDDNYRKEREKYFINKFNTFYKGLNKQV